MFFLYIFFTFLSLTLTLPSQPKPHGCLQLERYANFNGIFFWLDLKFWIWPAIYGRSKFHLWPWILVLMRCRWGRMIFFFFFFETEKKDLILVGNMRGVVG